MRTPTPLNPIINKMEKKLYVEISSGEESFCFTKEEALQLLSEEFDRVQREKREEEMGYEWDFRWMTEEDYAEVSDRIDKPKF